MENDVLISELKTVFLYHLQFLRYSKIEFFSTQSVPFYQLELFFMSKQGLNTPNHTGLCKCKFLCQNTWEKKAYAQNYSTKLVKNWEKITPIFNFWTQLFLHRIFPVHSIGSNLASNSSLMSSGSDSIKCLSKSFLMPAQRPKCYPYP